MLMSFDNHAKNWDTELRITRAKKIATEIEKVLEKAEVSIAMEFGCGTGLISFNIFERFEKVVLVDSSKGMIDIVNTKISMFGVNNMVAIMADICTSNTIEEKFDVIYSSMVLHHVNNITEIIDTFKDMLNPNGYLIIVDLDKEDGSFHKEYADFDGHNGFDQDDLRNDLASAGYEDIESRTFYHDIRVIDEDEIKYSLFLMKAKKMADNIKAL